MQKTFGTYSEEPLVDVEAETFELKYCECWTVLFLTVLLSFVFV